MTAAVFFGVCAIAIILIYFASRPAKEKKPQSQFTRPIPSSWDPRPYRYEASSPNTLLLTNPPQRLDDDYYRPTPPVYDAGYYSSAMDSSYSSSPSCDSGSSSSVSCD